MSQQSITLKAGSIFPVNIPGKYFSVVSCTAGFKVELDNGGYNLAVAGSQFSSAAGFSRINFSETSGADNTITFDASDTSSPGRATIVAANASTSVGPNSALYDFGALAPGASAPPAFFPGVDSQGRERKVIYITNSGRATVNGVQSTALITVFVKSLAGGAVYLVQPTTTEAIETSDDLVIQSAAADLTAAPPHLMGCILEIFYNKATQGSN